MLRIIQVGHNEASDRYIRNKTRALQKEGLEAETINLDDSATTESLVELITSSTAEPAVTAIMVQLPLPLHIDRDQVMAAIPPHLDIDGLNPKSDYRPLTPCAIMRWLKDREVDLIGKNVVVFGRSKLVGLPLANMLIEAGATVTVFNSHTSELTRSKIAKDSDILISAVGAIDTIRLMHVIHHFGSPQILIDVGINRDYDGRLRGDVSYSAADYVERHGGYVSPVPGGVGKWTVQELVLRLKDMEERRNVVD